MLFSGKDFKYSVKFKGYIAQFGTACSGNRQQKKNRLVGGFSGLARFVVGFMNREPAATPPPLGWNC
ncbi:hypothetical protein [Massilia glaciei]|uniref:hypothetical protein n=1 Tax=Massilia glaciei TaxID=1524097 RepID=UPI0011B25707|nr:hypothetical protein [Massilia glaciei]